MSALLDDADAYGSCPQALRGVGSIAISELAPLGAIECPGGSHDGDRDLVAVALGADDGPRAQRSLHGTVDRVLLCAVREELTVESDTTTCGTCGRPLFRGEQPTDLLGVAGVVSGQRR